MALDVREVKTVRRFERPLTVEEFMALPTTEGKLELHNGEVIEMAPPGGGHGLVQALLLSRLVPVVQRHTLGYAMGEAGFRLWPDRPTVYAPDVAFVRRARFPTGVPDGFIDGPPDVAVEIVSPHDRPSEVAEKVRDYVMAGTALVWVIDPEARTVTAHARREGGLTDVQQLEGHEVLAGGEILPGFAVSVDELLEGAA